MRIQQDMSEGSPDDNPNNIGLSLDAESLSHCRETQKEHDDELHNQIHEESTEGEERKILDRRSGLDLDATMVKNNFERNGEELYNSVQSPSLHHKWAGTLHSIRND